MTNAVDHSGGPRNRKVVEVQRVDKPAANLKRVPMTGVGLNIPVGLSFDAWERTGRQLSRIVDSSVWWLGDWLVFGKKYYPDRYERAIRAVRLRYQTLRNYAGVARRFDLDRGERLGAAAPSGRPALRRRTGVSVLVEDGARTDA